MKKEKELCTKISAAHENRLIANWQKRKTKKKNSNALSEASLKNERKNNLKRKQQAWKDQVKNAKRPKLNPVPALAVENEQAEEDIFENEQAGEDIFENKQAAGGTGAKQ